MWSGGHMCFSGHYCPTRPTMRPTSEVKNSQPVRGCRTRMKRRRKSRRCTGAPALCTPVRREENPIYFKLFGFGWRRDLQPPALGQGREAGRWSYCFTKTTMVEFVSFSSKPKSTPSLSRVLLLALTLTPGPPSFLIECADRVLSELRLRPQVPHVF